MAGEIKTAFDTAFRDFVIDHVPTSGANKPKKPEIRAIGTLIDDQMAELTGLVVSGIRWLPQTIRVRATGNVILSTDLENGDILNGVTLVTGDHVFLGSQTVPANNGIYTVVASGPASRAVFANTADELAYIGFPIQSGAVGAGESWTLPLAASSIVLGTTPLEFALTEVEPSMSAEVVDARNSLFETFPLFGDHIRDTQAGLYPLPPGLGYEDAAVGTDGGVRDAVAADGTGLTPLGLAAQADGFCHIVDVNGIQQIAHVNTAGVRQLTFGPEDKTLVGFHNSDSMSFVRKGVAAGEPVMGIVTKRWNTVTGTAPYTAPLVRMVITYGQSLALGTTNLTPPFVVNSNPPWAEKLFRFAQHMNPRGPFDEASLGNLVPAVEQLYSTSSGESASLAFGLGVLEAHDHSGPVITVGSGLGGAVMTDIMPGTAPYTNLLALVTAAKNKALAKWPGCTFQVAAFNFEHGQSDYFTDPATYQAQMTTLFNTFDADVATATGQASPPLHIVGQTRRNNTGQMRGADVAILDYAVANAGCLWRQPSYTLKFDDDITHLTSSSYVRRGVQAGLAYEMWIKTNRRPLLTMASAVRSANLITVTFANLPTRLAIDPTIGDDGTLGFWYDDNNSIVLTDNSAMVRRARITGARTVEVELDKTPTGTAKRICLAWADAANGYTKPTRTAGMRTPLCSYNPPYVDYFTGEPCLIRPAGQAFAIA